MKDRDRELPKGMAPPTPPANPQEAIPPFYGHYLRRYNYMAEIYSVLELAAVKVHIIECEIREQEGQPPEVELKLLILGKKEGFSDAVSDPE